MEKLNESISEVLSLMRRAPELEQIDVFRRLVREGMERAVAARLVEYLPIVYGRLLLEGSGVRCSDDFKRSAADGSLATLQFSSDPIWIAADRYGRGEIQRGISSDDWLKIAARSAEFGVANKLLHDGAQLKDIAISSQHLTWPEDGPPDSW